MQIRHTAPLVGLFCLVLAGCTTVSPGEATSTSTSEISTTGSSPTPSSSNGGDLPSNGAPKVTHPLDDTSRFEQNPCSILTSTQTQELDLPSTGREDDGLLGLDCQWFNQDTQGQVTIGFLSKDSRGLSSSYAANEQGKYKYFNPLPPVEGYPAITYGTTDRRSSGICSVEVGVRDQLSFHVDLQLSQVNVGTKDPCATAAKVAGKALLTMKGA